MNAKKIEIFIGILGVIGTIVAAIIGIVPQFIESPNKSKEIDPKLESTETIINSKDNNNSISEDILKEQIKSRIDTYYQILQTVYSSNNIEQLQTITIDELYYELKRTINTQHQNGSIHNFRYTQRVINPFNIKADESTVNIDVDYVQEVTISYNNGLCERFMPQKVSVTLTLKKSNDIWKVSNRQFIERYEYRLLNQSC
ncbi:MAG: DUF4101 domain-containing protein [Tolypothrix brevis GSE-NOS-MK-07-07A]|jgi:hypothetical protein|nr:DUF4101 domain-containing protein [Tolypothrix brevis GSE-NOS-MK-07-07A]